MDTEYLVLLTDDNDDTLLVHASDIETAERIAGAAVFSDGGVSAWLVPQVAVEASERLAELLREGHNLYGVVTGLDQ